MTQSKLLQVRSDGRFLKYQIRSLKGLRQRIEKLKQAWDSGSESVQQQIDAEHTWFESETQQLATKRRAIEHNNMESWDVELDQHMGFVERELLTSVQYEKSELKRLKIKLNNDKEANRKQRDDTLDRLKRELETNQEAARKTRDSVRAKLVNEKRGIDEMLQDAREWVLVKVGRDLMGEPNTNEADIPSADVRDLQELARCYEDAKKKLGETIALTKSHPKVKWYSSIWFYSLGVLGAIVAGLIAWLLLQKVLLPIGIGLVSSIVLTAILHFATRPLVARVIQQNTDCIIQDAAVCFRYINQGHAMAEAFYQRELARLVQKHQADEEIARNAYLTKREAMTSKFEAACQALAKSCAERRFELSSTRSEKFSSIDQRWESKWSQIQKELSRTSDQLKLERDKKIDKLKGDFSSSQEFRIARWNHGCRVLRDRLATYEKLLKERQPDWNSSYFDTSAWRRDTANVVWRLGHMDPTTPLLQEALERDPTLFQDMVPWPVALDLLSHGSLVLDSESGTEATSDAVMQNVCLRAITSVPAGSLQMTIIDPQGLGKKFSWLMSVADVNSSLVGDRVWTQSLHIADQLARAARHVEDVIQQSLRNNFSNLYEFNQQAGPMAIPYRLIVWDQFPFGLDDHSWQSLMSILASGARCGVGVLLRTSDTAMWPTFADKTSLLSYGMHLRISKRPQDSDSTGRITVAVPDFSDSELIPDLAPTEARVKEIMTKHLDAVAEIGKMIVPFDSIELPQAERQIASSAEHLSIPIGVSAAGRTQFLKLGIGTSQHVLIAGKTGSGKSSLLHTMITSAAMKYAPDQLRLVLLDFKKGVEFQVYSESELAHTDIIGIESRREFGVSTLEYLDRVMHARGEAFREYGVQDLPSLAAKHPEVVMPRILIVIDEFQEMFVEDDKIAQQASMLMDRIVRQGRSFGMHLVLASQTLGGAYSLPRTTLAQMAVRIALQCDSSDAMLILSEDNTAAERLRYSGQAIYNESGGRVESNQGFQVSYLSKDDQLALLHALPAQPVPHSPTTNVLGRRVVFEGHKPAIWDQRSIDLALESTTTDTLGYTMLLGDSVAIDPPIFKQVHRSPGRNCFVVGTEESTAASILAGCVTGFVRIVDNEPGSQGTNSKRIRILNGIRPEDKSFSKLMNKLSERDDALVSSPRDLDEFMESLQAELDKRLSEPQTQHPTMLVAIANLSRFRELRKGDEYSFGEDSGSSKPDAILSNLLKDGSGVGMFVWLWSDTAGTLTRWLSRQSIRDGEIRILMQMSANDSNQLIDSNIANKLEPHVAIIQDDMDGKPIKFRPFDLDSVLLRL
ncbi:FtsK/SpoIIIE domain-containing protein [Pirellulaceae bacterium SH449]